MKNMKNDCTLIAEKNKIDFIWNDKFPINSLYLMRGYLFINNNKKDKYFDLCFDAYWKNNEDISNEETIKNILQITDDITHNSKIKNSFDEAKLIRFFSFIMKIKSLNDGKYKSIIQRGNQTSDRRTV